MSDHPTERLPSGGSDRGGGTGVSLGTGLGTGTSGGTPDNAGVDGNALRTRRVIPPWILGLVGVVVAIAAAVVTGVGVAEASALRWELGAVLAWVATGLSAAAIIVGLVAVIRNRGRRLGVLAMVTGMLANPLVLVWLFGTIS